MFNLFILLSLMFSFLQSCSHNYWCLFSSSHANSLQQKRVGESRLSQTMMSHSRDVLNKLRSQREAGLFCDITLRTDGRSYSAHKAVLVAVSEYFQEVFTEMDSAPSARSDIDLTGMKRSHTRLSERGCFFIHVFLFSSIYSALPF